MNSQTLLLYGFFYGHCYFILPSLLYCFKIEPSQYSGYSPAYTLTQLWHHYEFRQKDFELTEIEACQLRALLHPLQNDARSSRL